MQSNKIITLGKVSYSMEDNKNTKHCGANIPESLFWKFKSKIAERRESTQEGLIEAIKLYVDSED